jgi:3D (Asp-Asp-Asp) domain-containing protein
MGVAILSLSLAAIPIGSAHSNYHYKGPNAASRYRHSTARQRWLHSTVVVTAYVVRRDPLCDNYIGKTRYGEAAAKGTVATDPHVFPRHTRFRIPGYGWGIATDTGGDISGHRIDVAMLSCRDAWNFGRRTLTILYLLPMKDKNDHQA